jgi:hypothetical protein
VFFLCLKLFSTEILYRKRNHRTDPNRIGLVWMTFQKPIEPNRTACIFISRLWWLLCLKPNQTTSRSPLNLSVKLNILNTKMKTIASSNSHLYIAFFFFCAIVSIAFYSIGVALTSGNIFKSCKIFKQSKWKK